MFEVIHTYSRKQAIEDGILIDVTEMAEEAGFRYPVAVTRTLWEAHIKTEGTERSGDTNGRLWDTLWMLRVRLADPSVQGSAETRYEVLYGRKRVQLKAVCGPGDNYEPVITIMLPDEA
jgi:hypothetical protein